jgi:TolA-binding protein
MGNFEKALSSYNNFLLLKGTYSTSEYPLTHYGVGYCLFKTGKYEQAGVSFRKFINHSAAKDPVMVNDAYLRSGDCYYVERDYSSALTNYERVVKNGGFDGDYAMFQIALANGVQKQFDKKREALEILISKYPKSPLVDDAYYELALTGLVQNKNQEALAYLQKIITNYPASNYTSKAMLRKGLIYYNDNQNDMALNQLKGVVTKFPGTPDAKEALVTISNIYVEMNRVNDYLSYVSSVPFASVSMGKQDSLLYVAAENQYLKGDCETSSKGFFNYLEKYPNGIFVATAAYYLGDCAGRNGKQDEALRAFEKVISQSDAKFKEKAFGRAAAILYKKNEIQQSLNYYRNFEKYSSSKNSILDALQGQMRCHFQLNSYDSAMIMASRFMASEKISQEQLIEGHSIMARSAFQMGNVKLAEKEFGILTKIAQNDAAAEAQYYLALIAYERKDMAQAEKAVFKLVNDFPAMDFWRVKGFILLSDVYAANGNLFQAKQTLQSIIDNYEGAELREIAIQKMALLK